MKIATYNVNSIKSRLPQLLDWLARAAPDVVCLQELKIEDLQFPHKALEKAGYGAIAHGQRSWKVSPSHKGTVPIEVRRGCRVIR